METVFLVIVGVLFVLAIVDLVVGVSNDAVNFLISAIGSKAAPFRVIMIVASLGVLIGATFSGGMMEVARKGIFHPEFFSFNEIMIIFLAVMLTDIILLDVFNTLGMPTSTTVSIVFELLGSAVAMSIVLISKNDESLAEIGKYINSDKALMMIAGILLSVVIAFTVGAFIQYLSRLLFSFNLNRSYKRFGALWGGIAITSITYFILVKGLKGSYFDGDVAQVVTGSLSEILAWTQTHLDKSFVSAQELMADLSGKYSLIETNGSYSLQITLSEWIEQNTLKILGVSFVAWVAILAVLQFLFKANILKMIVLVGTFALAMAFAGNDLVNFIGVPLAGWDSYELWVASGEHADHFMMTGLGGAVKTPTLFLLLSGIIMVVTLWLSKKARAVTETSINLSRQDEGSERFESFALSRSLVRVTIKISKVVEMVMPNKLKNYLDRRFIINESNELKDNQAFDLVRASVNLMVAGMLIAFGTSLKLPLSTTYVTFMVAMGSSLADRAWGRESAVYRVSGVLSVIAGWFITAIVAFTVAFIFANLINWGGIIAITVILVLAGAAIVRSQVLGKRKTAEKEEIEIDQVEKNPYETGKNNVLEILTEIPVIFTKSVKALAKEDRKKLKKAKKMNTGLNTLSKSYKDNVYSTLQQLKETDIHSGPYFVQVLDYLREITHAMYHVVKPAYEHTDNNHKALLPVQIKELETLAEYIEELFAEAVDIIRTEDYNRLSDMFFRQKEILEYLEECREGHITRIKKQQVGTRNSILYLNMVAEIKNMLLYIVNLAKSQRDFVLGHKKNKLKK